MLSPAAKSPPSFVSAAMFLDASQTCAPASRGGPPLSPLPSPPACPEWSQTHCTCCVAWQPSGGSHRAMAAMWWQPSRSAIAMAGRTWATCCDRIVSTRRGLSTTCTQPAGQPAKGARQPRGRGGGAVSADWVLAGLANEQQQQGPKASGRSCGIGGGSEAGRASGHRRGRFRLAAAAGCPLGQPRGQQAQSRRRRADRLDPEPRAAPPKQAAQVSPCGKHRLSIDTVALITCPRQHRR